MGRAALRRDKGDFDAALVEYDAVWIPEQRNQHGERPAKLGLLRARCDLA